MIVELAHLFPKKQRTKNFRHCGNKSPDEASYAQMKTRPTIPPLLASTLLAFFAILMPSARAQILWTGPNTNFSGGASSIVSVPPADVIIPGAVSLTRHGNGWLYNTNVDACAQCAAGTPSDTEWAFGTLANFASLTYQTMDVIRAEDANFDFGAVLVTVPPSPMVLHLINENIYIQVTFTSWPQHAVGTFAYTRSTPAVVTPPKPTVSITNPVANAVFAAPANVKISASASVSSGTVTNVSFFGNSSPLGSAQTAPFSITSSSLGAGSYGLTAVATAAGVSATSSVVNISVVTPVATSLSGPSEANNQFSFSYTVNPGLKYVVQSSSNMLNWTPLSTNDPGSNPAFFTNPITGPDSFYRVGRMPNP